jgi:hypothetical protein
MDQGQTLVNTAVKLQVQYKAGNFLTSRVTISFSRRLCSLQLVMRNRNRHVPAFSSIFSLQRSFKFINMTSVQKGYKNMSQGAWNTWSKVSETHEESWVTGSRGQKWKRLRFLIHKQETFVHRSIVHFYHRRQHISGSWMTKNVKLY